MIPWIKFDETDQKNIVVKNNNYFGEDYHNYKDNQSKSHTFWKEYFYGDKISNKDILEKQISYVNSEFKLFINNLIN